MHKRSSHSYWYHNKIPYCRKPRYYQSYIWSPSGKYLSIYLHICNYNNHLKPTHYMYSFASTRGPPNVKYQPIQFLYNYPNDRHRPNKKYRSTVSLRQRCVDKYFLKNQPRHHQKPVFLRFCWIILLQI